MNVIDMTFANLSPTLRSILALGSTFTAGALVMTVFQSYIGVPAKLDKMQEENRIEVQRLSSEIATNRNTISTVQAQVDRVDLGRLSSVVEELAFQICIDRAERDGTLDSETSLRCRTSTGRVIR